LIEYDRPMVNAAPAGADAALPQLDVSIILPVYNEAEHLEQEVDRVRMAMDASDYSYEIIVVDDGSSDNSAEVASRIEGMRSGRWRTG